MYQRVLYVIAVRNLMQYQANREQDFGKMNKRKLFYAPSRSPLVFPL